MEYRLLGPLEVRDAGRPVDVGSRQQRALLALLLANTNRVVSTDRILEELWPNDFEGKEKTLWVYISRLRSALEPDRAARAKSSVLVTRDHGYSLVADPASIDVHRFEEMVEHGRSMVRDDPAAASDELLAAHSLWRGQAYEDFAYEQFAQPEIARLEELRLVAMEDRIDADLRCSRHREVIGELEALVMSYPLRERPVELLMIALYRAGRQADALRAFQTHRDVVAEMGIEPSPELSRVEEQVLLHDPRLNPLASPHGTADAEAPNPFKGLHAFSEADNGLFFGRDRLLASILRRLSDGRRMVALVGASGSGKSSVIHAGLTPALRKGAIAGSDGWLIASMVPGARPFTELEAGLLRSTLDAPESLADLLDHPEDGLLRASLRLLPSATARLVLIIDQFEELFTLVGSGERDRFVRNLEVALDDPHVRIIVVVALRADFYDRPLVYPGFASLLGDGVVNTVPLTPDELEAAAQQPAAAAGVHLEQALLVRLLTDVAGESGALPLFQYTLTELFDRRVGGLLTLQAYEDMGGVQGAVSRRAEGLFQALDAGEQEACHQLFLRLVTIADAGAWSRRRVAASEVATIAVDKIDLQTVLDRFGTYRLLTFDRDYTTGSPTVEVAHEALLYEWDRLTRWIEEGREDVRRHSRFVIALSEWRASGEKADYLLSGERLADYESWADQSPLHLTTAERRFLDASIEHRDEVMRAEEERAARESKLGRQARRRLAGLAIGGVLLAALAGALLLVALRGDDPRIAAFHSVTGDFGMNDLMLAGVATAEREHDLTIERVEPLVDPEADLRHLAETGTELILVSNDFDLLVEHVAPDYPEVRFVAIDPVQLHIRTANITEIHFAVHHSAFLAGAAAAMATETGVVGFIGGVQSPRVESSRSGFEQGATYRDSGVKVISKYLGPIENPLATAASSPDLARELAQEMYREGADVIFHDADESGAGVLAAAREMSDGPKRWVIGSDVDEYVTASSNAHRSHILSSAVKRYDTAVVAAIDAFLDDSLEDGDVVLGLQQGAVALSRSGGHLAAFDGLLDNLDGDVAFGHIKVFESALTGPGWQYPPDVTVRLVMNGSECTAQVAGGDTLEDGRLRVPRGTRIAFDFVNESDLIGGLSLAPIPPGVGFEQLLEEARQGIPASFEPAVALTETEPGATSAAAAVMTGQPFAADCFWLTAKRTNGEEPGSDLPALIVSPGT